MKKLKLNKKTIIDLSSSEMNNLKGGAPSLVPWECQTLLGTACPDPSSKPDRPEPAETEGNNCPEPVSHDQFCTGGSDWTCQP